MRLREIRGANPSAPRLSGAIPKAYRFVCNACRLEPLVKSVSSACGTQLRALRQLRGGPTKAPICKSLPERTMPSATGLRPKKWKHLDKQVWASIGIVHTCCVDFLRLEPLPYDGRQNNHCAVCAANRCGVNCTVEIARGRAAQWLETPRDSNSPKMPMSWPASICIGVVPWQPRASSACTQSSSSLKKGAPRHSETCAFASRMISSGDVESPRHFSIKGRRATLTQVAHVTRVRCRHQPNARFDFFAVRYSDIRPRRPPLSAALDAAMGIGSTSLA